MPFRTEYQEKFQNLQIALAPENRDQIRRDANGGNTVLFLYPPQDEELYIEEARKRYNDAEFIDLHELLIEYISEIGWEDFSQFFSAYSSQPYQVFKNEGNGENLYTKIIYRIKDAISRQRLPFLIHTGALYGTEIENIHIMQHPEVMRFDLPLVVFYPAVYKSETQILFLGVKPASKYRCKLVN